MKTYKDYLNFCKENELTPSNFESLQKFFKQEVSR